MRSALFGAILISGLFISSCTTQKQMADLPSVKTPAVQPGMWMLPQLQDNLYESLTGQGLQISREELYSKTEPSIHRAVARINVGGAGAGTGSFVSDKGLLLTNHHIAYEAISAAGAPQENLLENGFYADEPEYEIPIPEYTLHIPIEQEDITEKVYSKIDKNLAYRKKARKIEEVKHRIIEEYTEDKPDLFVEINPIWSGNRYILSSYQIIRDVRLVYAPEESIGNFGGDIDNWMWPRHTGDYAFLRAYVDQNGSAAPYQSENRPYRPEYVLPVSNSELQAGDFTLTLGYPGSTYRHESSYAFHFYETRQLPSLEKAFQAYLDGLETASDENAEFARESAAERASIANSLKYYNGIRKGFARHEITEKKREFDKQFRQWVKADSLRELRYSRVLPQLEQSYSIADQTGDLLYLSFYALQFSKILKAAMLFDDLYENGTSDYTGEKRRMLYNSLRRFQQSFVPQAEQRILKDLLFAMAELPQDRRPLIFYRFFDARSPDELKEELGLFLDRRFSNSIITDTTAAAEFIFPEESATQTTPPDSLYLISKDIHVMFEQSRENYIRHFTYLLPAQQRYAEGVLEMSGDRMNYADANFTLRLSAGEIMGYSPADGVFHRPFTTFGGMLAKNSGKSPFRLPDKVLNYKPDPAHPRPAGVSNMALNFLSTNDITGGNSGSPVLNKHGELIGLVFDGNIEGIISDYYYVPDLTRTLSVDIRFILFMMGEIDHTDRLLNELEIRTN